jgi:hypothetical protein
LLGHRNDLTDRLDHPVHRSIAGLATYGFSQNDRRDTYFYACLPRTGQYSPWSDVISRQRYDRPTVQ